MNDRPTDTPLPPPAVADQPITGYTPQQVAVAKADQQAYVPVSPTTSFAGETGFSIAKWSLLCSAFALFSYFAAFQLAPLFFGVLAMIGLAIAMAFCIAGSVLSVYYLVRHGGLTHNKHGRSIAIWSLVLLVLSLLSYFLPRAVFFYSS